MVAWVHCSCSASCIVPGVHRLSAQYGTWWLLSMVHGGQVCIDYWLSIVHLGWGYIGAWVYSLLAQSIGSVSYIVQVCMVAGCIVPGGQVHRLLAQHRASYMVAWGWVYSLSAQYGGLVWYIAAAQHRASWPGVHRLSAQHGALWLWVHCSCSVWCMVAWGTLQLLSIGAGYIVAAQYRAWWLVAGVHHAWCV